MTVVAFGEGQVFGYAGVMKRHAVLLVMAVLLPLVILAGLQLYATVNASKRELEALSRSRADEISRLIDRDIEGELKLGEVLATATALKHDDVAGAYLTKPFDTDTLLQRIRRLVRPPRQVAPHEVAGGDESIFL